MNFIKQRATNGLWPFLMAKNKPHVSVADIICNKLTEQKVQHVFWIQWRMQFAIAQ